MPENHSGKHVQGELGSANGAQKKVMADEQHWGLCNASDSLSHESRGIRKS